MMNSDDNIDFTKGGTITGPVEYANDEYPGRSNPEVVMPLDKLKGMLAVPAFAPKAISTNINLSPEIIPLFNHDPLEARRSRTIQLQMKKMDSHIMGDNSFTEQDRAELDALYAFAESLAGDDDADDNEGRDLMALQSLCKATNTTFFLLFDPHKKFEQTPSQYLSIINPHGFKDEVGQRWLKAFDERDSLVLITVYNGRKEMFQLSDFNLDRCIAEAIENIGAGLVMAQGDAPIDKGLDDL